jgi:signal transduction histidine kinase
MRYFIIDDELPFCLQLQELLEKAAAEEVEFACNITDALKYFHERARTGLLPDVILCDYRLSNSTTGVDFLKALQEEDFHVPAVLLTDFDDQGVIARTAEQFGVVHIAKTGLETAELVQQISFFAFRRWADQRRLANQQVRRQAGNMLRVGAEIAHEFQEVIRNARRQFERVKRARKLGDVSLALLERLGAQLDRTLDDGIILSDLLMKYGGEIQNHEVNLELTEVSDEIESVAGQPEFAHLKVHIKLDSPSDRAIIDRFIVRRALSVLLRNILDHAKGAHDVDVTIGETARHGRRALYIDVEDYGKGVKPEHRQKIFEAGERGGKDIQYFGGGGLGLGLGFAKTLVELHSMNGARGAIHCLDGTSGAGARFRISLPQE